MSRIVTFHGVHKPTIHTKLVLSDAGVSDKRCITHRTSLRWTILSKFRGSLQTMYCATHLSGSMRDSILLRIVYSCLHRFSIPKFFHSISISIREGKKDQHTLTHYHSLSDFPFYFSRWSTYSGNVCILQSNGVLVM